MSSAYEILYKVLSSPPDPYGKINNETRNLIKELKRNNLQVVLSYPPKVGGTYIRTALVILLQKNYHSFLSRGSYASTDQSRDLYFPTIFHQHILNGAKPFSAIMHCHMYSTNPVRELIELFEIKTIIQTRNILDTLLSYYEMHEKSVARGQNVDDEFMMSSGKSYSMMSQEEKRFALVHVAPVWYAKFYGKWLRYTEQCKKNNTDAPLWVTYRELENSPENLLEKIVTYCDPENTYAPHEIKAALDQALRDKDAVRFNKGISGRGENFFSEEEKETIYKIMSSIGEDKLEQLEII